MCTRTCGGGLRSRSRICVNGEIGDPGCIGPLEEDETCNEQVGAEEIWVIFFIIIISYYVKWIDFTFISICCCFYYG